MIMNKIFLNIKNFIQDFALEIYNKTFSSKYVLKGRYSRIEEDEAGYIRVYDTELPENIVEYLYENGLYVTEIKTDKIGLEEYYIDLMKEGK